MSRVAIVFVDTFFAYQLVPYITFGMLIKQGCSNHRYMVGTFRREMGDSTSILKSVAQHVGKSLQSGYSIGRN